MVNEIPLTQVTASTLRLQEATVTNRNNVNKTPAQANQGQDNLIKENRVQENRLKENKESEKDVALDVAAFVEKKNEEEKELNEKVTDLNDFVQNISRDLQFSIHEESGRTVVTVIDSETEDVIRTIPSEEVLRIAESLENLSGLLLKEQA